MMKSDEWFRARAKDLYHEEGEIEVDGDAHVSIGDDDGAYVQAWVWVPLKEERRGAALLGSLALTDDPIDSGRRAEERTSSTFPG